MIAILVAASSAPEPDAGLAIGLAISYFSPALPDRALCDAGQGFHFACSHARVADCSVMLLSKRTAAAAFTRGSAGGSCAQAPGGRLVFCPNCETPRAS